MSVTDTIIELLEPVFGTVEVELVDVEYVGGVLRVTIDQDGGIPTDTLAQVNRLISPILDQHDPIPGRYTLEVSSPGVERRLNSEAHYRRAIGENVIVKLFPGHLHRRYRGELVEVSDDGLVVTVDAVEIDGIDLPEIERYEISVSDVAKARTVFDWGPGPKPGKQKKAQSKTPKSKQAQSKTPKSK